MHRIHPASWFTCYMNINVCTNMHNITTTISAIMSAYEAIHTCAHICQLILYIPIVSSMQPIKLSWKVETDIVSSCHTCAAVTLSTPEMSLTKVLPSSVIINKCKNNYEVTKPLTNYSHSLPWPPLHAQELHLKWNLITPSKLFSCLFCLFVT